MKLKKNNQEMIKTIAIKNIRTKFNTKIKCWWIKLKKNQLEKELKIKQITIKRIRIKIDTNTNWHDTFNFWKGWHEI